MSCVGGPREVTANLVFYYDISNTQKSWKGAPTTNYVTNALPMTGWNNYSNGTPVAINTSLGTPGYGFYNAGSWNGIYKSITLPSTGTYTFSAWIRYIGGSANNNGGGVYISGWGGADSSTVTNRTLPGQWQRLSITLNCTNTTFLFYLISWGGTNGSDNSSWEMTMPQAEPGSFVTPFVNGTRGTSNNIIDLTGINTIPATSLTYSSNGTFSFNGTSDKLYQTTIPSSYSTISNALSRTWEVVAKPTATLTTAAIFGHKLAAGCSYFCNGGIYIWGGYWCFNWFDNVTYQFLSSGVTSTSNVFVHIIGSYDATDQKTRIYINGGLSATFSSNTNMNYGGGIGELNIGWNSKNDYGGGGPTDYFTGIIPIVKYYSGKSLSSSEVQQNFNALRGRYGL